MLRIALAVALTVTASAPVPADSWAAFRPFRSADHTGRYYVIVRAGSGYGERDARFVWAASVGSETRPEQREYLERLPKEAPKEYEPALGDRDRVLARGPLAHAPMEVLVSSAGRGFVAIEKYGNLGYGKSLQIVDAEGKVRHQLELKEIFDEPQVDEFRHTVSSIWWRRGSWLDEPMREVILVSTGAMRAVHLETGAVRDAGDEDVRRALQSSDPAARTLALELARERSLAGLDEVLSGWVNDEEAPLAARLRSAAFLAERGDRRGAELVRAVATGVHPAPVSEDDTKYAVRHLAQLWDEEALPILRDILRGKAGSKWTPAIEALGEMGERAVPTLLEMLAEKEESPDSRGSAAHALARTGSRQALPGLLRAIEDPVKYVANAATNAAIGIAGEDIASELAATLARGSTQDARLANYFKKHRHPDAIPALEKARRRHADGSYEASRIDQALEFQ